MGLGKKSSNAEVTKEQYMPGREFSVFGLIQEVYAHIASINQTLDSINRTLHIQ